MILQNSIELIQERIAFIESHYPHMVEYKKALEMSAQALEKQLKAGGENISSNEWITISERLPNPETYVLLSFENVSIPVIGRYEQDKDGGAFYAGDEDETLTSQDMYVNAWMPLPEPYKESEDIARNNR